MVMCSETRVLYSIKVGIVYVEPQAIGGRD